MNFHTKQLQRKFKHALDFGITGSYNKNSEVAFQTALQKHISHPDMQVINGTYRGSPATFYVDVDTRLAVVEDAIGNFLSGWRLSEKQRQHVLTHGKLN